MKIAIALSGGVDSAVAAKILKDEGYQLVGFFLMLWSDPHCQIKGENRCCNYEALEDARSVAAKLEIPFYVIDAKKEFKKAVVDYFIDEYKSLRTPNPCVVCNEKIKFDLLLKKALSVGCDHLATGHYARIENAENPKSQIPNPKQIQNPNVQNHKKLKAGVDKSKDQSYNLYRLNQEQLAHIMFPLGELTKKEVRALAVKWDLPVKEKPESQEICFFGDSDYRDFLRRYLPAKYFRQGEIVSADGNIIGQHEGLSNYTIGQRKGVDQKNPNIKILNPKQYLRRVRSESDIYGIVGQNSKSEIQNGYLSRLDRESINKTPLYVIDFDVSKNQLIVGGNEEVYKKEMVVSDLHWINPRAISYQLKDSSFLVKIRSQAHTVQCRIKNQVSKIKYINNVIASQADVFSAGAAISFEKIASFLAMTDTIEVVFQEKQRAITPGQSAVFYVGDEVIGGGVIC